MSRAHSMESRPRTTPRGRFQALFDFPLAEEILAQHGYAVVSAKTMEIIERIRLAPHQVAISDYEKVLYEVWSGPISDYWPK